MKIIFEDDGSFIELLDEEDKITIVMCGKKSYRETIMSKAQIDKSQVSDIVDFLIKWKNK